MAESTSRLMLPLLVSGQGQKDITHNEALMRIDALLHPVAASRQLSVPPATPPTGTCWLVSDGGSGAWLGRDGQLACWSEGGWRFMEPLIGFKLWILDERLAIRLLENGWVECTADRAPADAVTAPIGGAVIDSEARQAIVALLGRLSGLGLIAP